MAINKLPTLALESNAITADLIASGAITAADISDGEISADKLAATLDLSSKTITLAPTPSGCASPIHSLRPGGSSAHGAPVNRLAQPASPLPLQGLRAAQNPSSPAKTPTSPSARAPASLSGANLSHTAHTHSPRRRPPVPSTSSTHVAGSA